jgi:hypothetical protein
MAPNTISAELKQLCAAGEARKDGRRYVLDGEGARLGRIYLAMMRGHFALNDLVRMAAVQKDDLTALERADILKKTPSGYSLGIQRPFPADSWKQGVSPGDAGQIQNWIDAGGGQVSDDA